MPANRSLLLVLLGLCAFVATSAAIRSLFPLPEALGLRQKIEHFHEVEDDYDLVYLGSSFLLRSAVPDVIDERLAAAGRPIRSYNLGVPAMTSFETDHVLRQLVARRPARLRWVVLEPDQWFPLGPNDSALVTQRNTGWHSPRQTANVLGFLWREPIPVRRKLEQSWGHFGLLARHLTAYGRGHELLAEAFGTAERLEPFSDEELGPGRGYQALDQLADQQHRRRLFQQQGAEWSRRLSALAATPSLAESPPREVVRTHFPARFHVAAVENQVDFLRRHGIEPIYLVPPVTTLSPPRRFLLRGGYVPNMLLFDVPQAYPELYRPEVFFDLNHLNDSGARAFSERFADALLPYLEPEEL